MRKNQVSLIGMFYAIFYQLTANKAKWVSQTALKQVVAQFETDLASLANIARDAGRNLAGVTLSKKMLREFTINRALSMSGKLVALASATKNFELKKAMSFTKSSFNRKGVGAVYDIGNSILAQLNIYAAQLVDYDIDQIRIDAFSELIEEYKKSSASTRNAAATRKALKSALKEKIAEIKLLVKEQLDTLLLPYKESDKVFYDEYRNNRIIINSKTSFTQLSGIVTNASTKEPVNKALVSVSGTAFFTNTKADGSFSIRIPKPGLVEVKVEVFGFETVTKSEVEIKLGKNTELFLALKAL